jgi:hypothetical protein
MLRGVDVSNYDFSTYDAACFKNKIDWLAIGCQREDYAVIMASAARAASIPILCTYAFLYFGFNGFMGFDDLIKLETEKAIRVAKQFDIGYVALDVEASGVNERSGVTPDERVSNLDRAISMVLAADLKVIIYTGKYYWQGNMGSVNRSEFPLWHASYWDDGHYQSEVDYWFGKPVAIHQYTSSFNLCGRNRDANVLFDESLLLDKEEEMKVEELNQAMVMRFNLIRLASDTTDYGYIKLIKIIDLLKKNNLY